ncbi:uncharacterized protein THITE_2107987 [Thermothielavioides terrestris NRRL 8126]|uniref:Uncharacterized protein n=1 Tax=Thermothielavioides terrestris (strain ATCC 38088 / NRRL 8126) TaxID=578455 RepID=G2QWU9_THETT|nr:uncharacterized protein THITE_2107987 [Thermothielavioides terrestris NRRL 8126]AEO63113.1 hypothetical protein THITE_2107987 [Thermothielavioides terrestris NRRL 8126]
MAASEELGLPGRCPWCSPSLSLPLPPLPSPPLVVSRFLIHTQITSAASVTPVNAAPMPLLAAAPADRPPRLAFAERGGRSGARSRTAAAGVA